MAKSYIGITGFMNRTDVENVLVALPDSFDRDLMVGVLASSKTIKGIKNKYPKRYPEPKQLSQIFTSHPKALNLIHYNTKEPDTLFDQLITVTNMMSSDFHGFQLNIAWPDPKAILKYAKYGYLSKYIVLQISKKAFDAIGNSPIKLAQKLKDYPMVDYVLLDPSSGTGKELNPEVLAPYIREIKDKLHLLKIGVAGGLSPKSVKRLLGPLVEEFPDLSIDAEGRLRDRHDDLDAKRGISYVRKTSKLFPQ